jgi:hypothetical protein
MKTSASSVREAENVPVSVPVVLPVVTVREIGTEPPKALAKAKDELKVPVPVRPPVKLAVPVAEMLPAVLVPDPLIVSVVLTVAACAPAHSKEITASPPSNVFIEPFLLRAAMGKAAAGMTVAARYNCLRMLTPPGWGARVLPWLLRASQDHPGVPKV